MNYAIRPADQTPIICRKSHDGKNVVFLLSTLHKENMTLERYNVGDEPTTTRVSVHEYHLSKGLSDAEEALVADEFVKAWNVQNGVILRKRLFKSYHHTPNPRASANTSLRRAADVVPEQQHVALLEADPVKLEHSKETALAEFTKVISEAMLVASPVENLEAVKKQLANQLLIALTKAIVEVLWEGKSKTISE